MPLGPDDALVDRDRALGAKHRDARRAFVIAADAQGKIDAEIDAIGIAELDLRVIANRPEDADVGNDPLPRPDERHQLLAGEFALLIQVFELGELAPRARRALPDRPASHAYAGPKH